MSQHEHIVVRDATREDLARIVEIYNESIPAGKATADTRPISVAAREQWFEQFEPGRRPCWVAVDEGEVVGCCYLTSWYQGRPAYDATAEVSTYLAGSHQRQGLGTMLKKRMIAACPGFGIENLISLYFDHNEATARMNARLGFEEVGHLPEIADVFGEKRGLKIGLLQVHAGEGG